MSQVKLFSFRMMLTSLERELVDKAMDSYESLETEEKKSLTTMYSLWDFTALPNPRKIRSQILTIAENQMIDKTAKFVSYMRKGIPANQMELFWSQLTIDSITSLFLKQKPTPEGVVACMKVEDEYVLKPEEERVFYFLKQYVLSLDQEDLATFLQFVTGSCVMPEYIQVTFNAMSGIMRHPTAHTCSNIIEMPNSYSSFQELKRELKNILHHSSSFRMTLV